jgi:coenzyme F420-0:L-glutamate ligase
MILIPVETPIIKPGDDLIKILSTSIRARGMKLEDGDILAISSKVVALAQGRIVRYDTVKPSRRARILGRKYSLEPGFVEIILREADEVYGGVYRAILTLKNKILVPSAGADLSNAPEGYAILWPENPRAAAEKIREGVEREFQAKIGVIIVDSYCIPLRAGTIGIALAVAGFKPVIDERGRRDLFGKELKITRRALADDLASAAHVLMGETDRRIPAVIIRGSGVEIEDKGDYDMFIPPDKCIFSSIYVDKIKRIGHDREA